MIIDNAGTYTLRYTATDECGNSTTVDRTLEVKKTTKIVPWSSGSDEEIVAMIAAADRGEINLTDYWNVGDERVVHLSAMSAISPLTDTHAEQDVTLVLMNAGGKTLNTPTESGRTECSFIVGQKNCLSEKGFINKPSTNEGGWDVCQRRTWCNSVYYNSFPETIKKIFKQIKNVTANGGSSATSGVESIDYFALPAEREVSNANSGSWDSYEGHTTLYQFEYFKTNSNRIKTENGTATGWFLRSPSRATSRQYCLILSGGTLGSSDAYTAQGISPFGAI